MNPEQFLAATRLYWHDSKTLVLRQARERIELGRQYRFAIDPFADGQFSRPLDEVATEAAQSAIEVLANELIDKICDFAVKVYSPNEVTLLDLPRQEIIWELDYHNAPETFDPNRLWQAIESRYGDGFGHTLAWRVRAREIARYFGISADEPVPMKNGRIVLTHNVYVEKYSRVRLGSSYSETLTRHFLPALISFATWANKPQLAAAIKPLLSRFSYPADVNSRESFLIGTTSEGRIKLVTYQTNFEWTFEPAISDALTLFMGEYFFLLSEMTA